MTLTDVTTMQFATAKHLNRLWRLFKRLMSASDERIAALEKIFLTDDTGDDLLAITDAAYRVLAALDRNGRARFEAGLTSRDVTAKGDLNAEGILHLRGTRLMESDDYGVFYILDSDDHILFSIDRTGSTDFKGIPTDIKARLDGLESRIGNLENNQ